MSPGLRQLSEEDLRRLDWFLGKVVRFGTVCRDCVHCRSIDVELNVDCDIIGVARMKVYCRDFKAKGEPKAEVKTPEVAVGGGEE
jgi:hypothetical protein